MKNFIILLVTIFFCNTCTGQISGIVKDSISGEPIPYVNVWMKPTFIGSSSNLDGKFEIIEGNVGKTLFVSCIGFDDKEYIAKEFSEILLKPKSEVLEEVLLTNQKKEEKNFKLTSFKKAKKVSGYFNNGGYTLARFYPYMPVFEETSFLKSISISTKNEVNEEVIMKVSLLLPDENGAPSDFALLENRVVKVMTGITATNIDVSDLDILFPKKGLFVVIEKLNLPENLAIIKSGRTKNFRSYQPAIGMPKKEEEKNTWLGFLGEWIPPNIIEEKGLMRNFSNVAVNMVLTN